MEDAFRDNFQGTYIRPPDTDGLSHIVQQPGESARKFWTRFLIKKNQIVDCPDTEALAAFKHSIRDEWLARHLGREKPKSMAALIALMTRFCAGEDSWLARSNNISKNHGTSDTKDTNGRPRRNRHKRRNNGDNAEARQSMPDSGDLSPFLGRSRSKRTIQAHPAWTAYLIIHARFMAP